jgi:hypothetical protein
VISISVRSDAAKQRADDAELRLENRLPAHRAEYESAGPLRGMGYNSPFVADEKRFIQLQILIT